MPKIPRPHYIILLLDWYGRFEVAAKLPGFALAVSTWISGSAVSAVLVAVNAAKSYLNAFLITLPLTLSIAIISVLVRRYKFAGPLEFSAAALFSLIGSSVMTGWLGLGVAIELKNVFSTIEALRISLPYALVGPLYIIVFPVVMLWEYLRLYGILGFFGASATGVFVARILTPTTP